MKNKILTLKKIIVITLIIGIILPFSNDILDVFASPLSRLFEKSMNNNEIRLLEIQPGNKSQFGTIGSTITQNIENNKVVIESITMGEFIGKVDQLNGKYDIIIIGRNNKELNSTYRDYSGINDNGTEKNTLNYVENDITNRKADEIIEFIKSGQLVYVDSSILNLNNSTNLKNTILYKKFNTNGNNNSDLNNLNNFINNEQITNLKLSAVIDRFISEDVSKRPKINVSIPEGDEINATVGNPNNRNMEFNINILEKYDNVDVKLYLDMNGDGLFKEKECFKLEENIAMQDGYKFSYEVAPDFFGSLDWKIELETESNVKSYVVGNIYFRDLGGDKKLVRVLQVTPESGGNLDLSENGNKTFNRLIPNLTDYTITVDTMKLSVFNNKIKNGSLKLNASYDMIIMGFADCAYGTASVNKETIDELKTFIATGQSVMFTHDTIADVNSSGKEYGSKDLREAFRDYLGQARFIDNYNETEKDIYKEYNVESGEYEDRYIPHYHISSSGIKGLSMYDHNINGMQRSSNVKKTNESLITQYPFKLDKEISVASTHTQYFQLNLEDPDVVPWYNIKGNNNIYDSKNSYYTYSKGNITYSGTGHSNGYTDDEIKLFINTIVKAERGANHAPKISSNIVEQSGDFDVEIPIESTKFEFTTTAKDLDNDKVDVVISVETKDENGNLIWTEIRNMENINQGTPIDVEVSNSYYQNRPNEIIRIKVEAVDKQGAKAEDKIYRIKPTLEPQVSVEVTGGRGLVGDNINLDVKLTKFNEQDNRKISDVKFQIKEYNTGVLSGLDKNISNIEFNNNSTEAIKKYIVNTNIAVSGETIKAELTYKLDNQEKKQDIIISVYSKKGEVILKTVDTSGNIITGFEGETTLQSISGFNSQVTMMGINNGRYTWPNSNEQKITTSNYTLGLTSEGTNYEVDSYRIINEQGNVIYSGSGTTANIGDVSYNNPKVEVIYKINRKKPVDTTNNDELRILEVQPGDKFKITNKQEGETTAGTEYITDEDINTSNNNNIKKIVIDHIPMPEFIGKVEQLNGLYDVIVIGRQVTSVNGSRDYSHITNNGNENSYKENDITKRKSEEIEKFVGTGQMVYLQKDILNDNIKNSNLYDLYTGIQNISNVKGYDTITLQHIIDEYKNNINKRPIISVDSPLGDESSHLWADGEDRTKDILGNYDNRNMEFQVKMVENKDYNGNYNLKLYLDINGDGLYTDKEIVKQEANASISTTGFKVSYDMPTDFVGMVNWKLEIEKTNTQENEEVVKSYVTGKSNFRRLEGMDKKVIKVLQIRPDIGLDLSTDERFKAYCEKVKDYNIQIETVSVGSYNTRADASYGGSDKIILNSNYDMIILGFANVYGQKDITNDSALKQIEDFIKSGQGVMFTHDTMLYNDYTNSAGNGPQKIRNIFRDYVGQTRFEPISQQVNVNSENNQTYTEGYYTDLGRYNGKIWGYTRYMGNLKEAEKVQQTNAALITDYPYDLSIANESNTFAISEIKANELEVRKTHTQWFQLNFEDPEVVPWYNIKGGNDPYDSRNSYYTYSKGNITFSGTGEHSYGGEYPNSELQLFVNTIIKAERGANHAPVIKSTIPEGQYETYDTEIEHNEDYKFKATATDIDNDAVKLEISTRCVNQPGDEPEWEYLWRQDNINKGQYYEVTVPSNRWNGNSPVEDRKILEIKIIATDSKGAKSEKVYKLRPTNRPIIEGIAENINGLIGDTILSNITLNQKNNNGNKIQNISIRELSDEQKSLFENISVTKTQDENINLQVTPNRVLEGYLLPIVVDYEIEQGSTWEAKVLEINVPINIKKGEIEVRVEIENNETLKANLQSILNQGNSTVSTADIDKNRKMYTWSRDTGTTITSNDYSLSLNQQSLTANDAEIKEYKINEITSSQGTGFNIGYENPKVVVNIVLSLGQPGEITKHGIYNKNIIGASEQEVIKGMYYTMGIEFNIGRNTSTLEVNLPATATLDNNNVSVFELNDNGTLGVETGTNITSQNNQIIVSNLPKGKKYILIYTSKFESDSEIKAELKYLNQIESNKHFNGKIDLIKDIENPENIVPNIPELF